MSARRRKNGDVPTRPFEPEFRAAQRCRVVFGYEEAGERQEGTDTGWGRIDGCCLHFLSDENLDSPAWTSYPLDKILCVNWEPVEAPPF